MDLSAIGFVGPATFPLQQYDAWQGPVLDMKGKTILVEDV
jgi:hypothetical protein